MEPARRRSSRATSGIHLKPGILLSRAQTDTRAVDPFKRGMAVIAKLQHPHIVRFLDSGSDEGTFFFFFFMEFCDGELGRLRSRRCYAGRPASLARRGFGEDGSITLPCFHYSH